MLRQGKERIKKFLKTLFNKFDPNDIWEVLIGTLNDISPDTKRRILTALQGFNGPLHVGTGAAILAVFPEQSEREQRERAIYNLVFEKIKEIVSNTDPAESSPEKIADHLLIIDQKQRTLSNVIINDFDFSMVFNLIRRIQQELNQSKSFDEEPNPEAIQAIKGLIQSLTKTERGTIIGISTDDEVNSFITDCCQNTIIKTLNQCILLDSMDDQTYYSLFVGNALDRVQRDYLWSWCADNAPDPC